MINVLLICGGGSTEHDISLVSAQYILNKLRLIPDVNPLYVCIEKDGSRTDEEGNKCELRKDGILIKENISSPIRLHYAIPCLHGYPGETGDIQSLFDMMGLPYLGAGPEASKVCFNKVSTKLWLSALGLANTPYHFLSRVNNDEMKRAKEFFHTSHQDVYIKASSQGSSIGCYHITKESDIEAACREALKLSPHVLIEQTVYGRELEVAVYEYGDSIVATGPGEIKSDSGFYSFEEKYAEDSKAQIDFSVQSIPTVIKSEILTLAKETFKGLKLKDMARVDFFLTKENKLYINEVNTFPGHTEISLFPQLLEHNNLKYEDYLQNRINSTRRTS